MPDTNDHAVIACFDSAAQAEEAAERLKSWDRAASEISLGAVGVLTRSARGTIETRNYSARHTGRGALVGLGLGALAAVLSGGLTLLPTLVAGGVVGGLLGALTGQGLGVTDETVRRLSAELDGGRAALLVLCDEGEVAATTAQVTAEGGRLTHTGPVSAAALQAAFAAAPGSESGGVAGPPGGGTPRAGRRASRRTLGATAAGAAAGLLLRGWGGPAGHAAVGAGRAEAAPGRQPVRFFPVAPPFEAYYALVDGPVVLGQAISPLTVFGGLPAQYFEKARLEDHVATNASGTFAYDFEYGLLVDEMAGAGAPAPVGGDASTLTYATIHTLADPALRVPPPAGFGGGVAALPDGGTFVPYSADLAAAPGQVVPAPFWAYLQRPELFPGGWLHDAGLPLTAAVPARVDKGRVVDDDIVFVTDVPITVQAFQRTVLTYDAANPEGFLVERANAGTDFQSVFPDQVPE